MTLDLEPEAHIDVNPEDIAAIEKQKRKKRLTDGWED
jgi:flagellar biosynthesis/type III secretory pathway protein FliH